VVMRARVYMGCDDVYDDDSSEEEEEERGL
jgi:hypothetical protein